MGAPVLKNGLRLLSATVISAGVIFAFWSFLGRAQSVREPPLNPADKLECVSYTPLKGKESPHDFLKKDFKIPTSRFQEDVALLSKHFSCIRVYSAMGLEELPPILREHGMQMMLGLWVGRNPVDAHKEMSQALKLARGYPEVIRAMIVGNEALLRKDINGTMLAAYIREVKAALPEVPVTYADVWEFWQENPMVAPSVDFITIHILPYWENDPAAMDDAMAHIQWVRESIVREFPDKEIFIGETGWPSFGRQREGAKPSLVNQARFLRGFAGLAREKGWHYNIIEAFDQPWKRGSEGGVGGYWGYWTDSRQPKSSLDERVSNFPRKREMATVTLALLVFFVLVRSLGAGGASLPKSFFVATFSSILLVLQAHQYLMLVRNTHEFLDYAFHLYLSALTACVFLFALRQDLIIEDFTTKSGLLGMNRTWSGKDTVSAFYWIHWVAVLGVTVLFIFDSRYRMFPTYGFLIPALFFALWARVDGDPRFFRLSALAGLMSMIGLLISEGWQNAQAHLWCAVLLLTMVPLIKRNPPCPIESLRFLTRFWPLYLGLGGAMAVRYGFLESQPLADICSQTDRPGWCGWYSVLGVAIHFRILPKLAFLGLAYFILRRKEWVLTLSQVLLAFGLVQYAADWAAGGVVLLMMILIIRGRTRTSTR